MAHFLLAEALFTLGKYREAVASIEEGMRLRPDWPGERFNLRQPYGDENPDYADHLERLEETLQRHPDDFFLLFLRAVHPHDRAEMTTVFVSFRDVTQVAPPAICAVLLALFSATLEVVP